MKFIALGSNLPSVWGNPADNIRVAAEKLSAAGIQSIACAPLYITTPVPKSDQPDFVNTVMQIEFSGTPEQALQICHQVEREMGRVRQTKNEPRIIDLDILAWDAAVQSGLPELPHPRLHERAFVIWPLFDLVPTWRHPVLQKTAAELKQALPGSEIKLSTAQWSGTGRQLS